MNSVFYEFINYDSYMISNDINLYFVIFLRVCQNYDENENPGT